MSRFHVTGRGDRLIFDDVGEEQLREWQASVERLVSAGAIPKPERFAIAEIVDGEPGQITNWRPRRLVVAAIETTKGAP